MRYIFLFLVILIAVSSGRATHIVGGEFELLYRSGNNYQLSLNLYFDNVNGNRGAIEPTAPVHIFEKATNRLVITYNLPLKSQVPVAYTAVACTNPSLSTDKITYTADLNFSPQVYNHPGGYYAVWERCCRNNVINNIIRPDNAGQVFYMEFPPVQVNGLPFRNSSPVLFPPLSDYACLNDFFYYDFGGKDPDGDSLVYEMVTPLNGNTHSNAPILLSPLPAPYLPVTWTAGLSTANQIPGSPSVAIDRNTGLLTLRPTQLGLFVFGVRCSEYRNKVKIGEIRRDFQLMVLNCPKNEPPKIHVRQAGKLTRYQEGDIIQVLASDNRCLDLFISDVEANAALTVEARPVNFSLPDQIIAVRSGIVNRNGNKDTLQTSACFPACLTSAGKTYLLDFIVSDNGCSLPKKDTVRVTFRIDPVPDQAPAITTTAPAQVLRPKLGEKIEFDVKATDANQDLVTLSLVGENFQQGEQAIAFPGASAKGQASSRFSWTMDCKAVSQQDNYLLRFTATTVVCGQAITTTTLVEVRPDYENAPPVMRSNMAGQTIEVALGNAFTDTVFATDSDLDHLEIKAQGDGFVLNEQEMTFLTTPGQGQAKGVFTWNPACQVTAGGQYRVIFTLTETTCQPTPPQQLAVTFISRERVVAPFVPANIFTPNQDGLNDYFTLPTLPPDFCESVFAAVKIFNRWGRQVYESRDRDFKWDGANISDGVYFYHVYYTDKQFKGVVTVVR